MQQPLYPFQFDPLALTRNLIWGGDSLKSLVPTYPAEAPLAELWAISDWPQDGRVGMVMNGPLAGVSFRELMQWYPEQLLGSAEAVGGRFPLLIKLIDAKQKLSVQVHPPVEVAKKYEGNPKAEAWLFLDGTSPDASIYAGFRAGVTQATFTEGLKTGEVEPMLQELSCEPGMVMNIPNGRVHGINPGCLILEVQQNSDSTYRVFDYNRLDAKTGKPRTLHVEQALASLNFADHEPQAEQPIAKDDERGSRTALLSTDQFTMERFIGQGRISEQTNDLPTVVVNVGSVKSLAVAANGQTTNQQRLEFSLVPAGVGEFTVEGTDLDYVLIRPVPPTAAKA